LNTTAFGLIIAIPSLVAYAIYQNRTDRIVGELTEESSKIFHDLLFRSESQTMNTQTSAVKGRDSVAASFTQGN
jgi:hypothetical protein